jgi:hypothetical protein
VSYGCRGCDGTCCTGVGSDPCTCPPPPEQEDQEEQPLYPRRAPGAHGKHCTWPECDGSCLITVTVEWRALESFYEAARWGRAMNPSTAGERTGLELMQQIIGQGKRGAGRG